MTVAVAAILEQRHRQGLAPKVADPAAARAIADALVAVRDTAAPKDGGSESHRLAGSARSRHGS